MSIFDKVIDTLKGRQRDHPIKNLVGNIARHKGLAQSNRFEVRIRGLANGIIFSTDDVNCQCVAVTMPGRSITTNQFQNEAEFKLKPTGYTNEPINITFRLTNSMYLYNQMRAWQESILNTKTRKLKYKNNYVAEVVIRQLDHELRPVGQWTLVNAWPVLVTGIESNQGAGEIAQFSVQFANDRSYFERNFASVI